MDNRDKIETAPAWRKPKRALEQFGNSSSSIRGSITKTAARFGSCSVGRNEPPFRAVASPAPFLADRRSSGSNAEPARRPSFQRTISSTRLRRNEFLSFFRLILVLCVVCFFGGGFAPTARAHKVIMFAAVQGNKIEGEIYYQGGTPVQEAQIAVKDPDGNTLGTVTAGEDGKFFYQPHARHDHHLVAELGMGHRVEYVVRAKELPAELPEHTASSSTPEPSAADHQHAADHEHVAGHEHVGGHDHGAGHEHGVKGELFSDSPAEPEKGEAGGPDVGALSRQVAALRADVERWKTRLRLQDILGGCGYILGIFGIWAYVLSRRQK